MDIFLIRVIASFFIAGIWIAGATLLAERLGSKIGGLLTNLPSNILISLLFVALVNGIPYVVNTVPAIPLGMTIDTLFLFVFVVCLKYGLALSTTISLLSWFILAYAATLVRLENLFVNMVVYCVVTLIAFVVLDRFFEIKSVASNGKQYTGKQLLIRAFFAGSVVAAVIVISKLFPPYIVGIFSTFPAVLVSTMVILAINQNKEFARATGKVMVLSSSNIVVYGLALYISYPRLGLIRGTIVSFLAAFIWVWLLHPIIRRIK